MYICLNKSMFHKKSKAMKTYISFLLVGLLFAFSCQAAPDLNVRPDASLTNEQVDQKLTAFRSVKAVDATPTEVVAAKFKSQFAAAYDVEWELANGVYEVEFEISNVDFEAWYDADGKLLKYKQDIAPRQLPDAVKKAVKQKYPKFRTDDADKIFKGTAVLYEVSVEKGEQEFKALFKEDGTFVKEKVD